jgi:hypothetical protein
MIYTDEIRIHLHLVPDACFSHFLWRTKQNRPPKSNIKSETKDAITFPRPNEPNFHTKYEYTDPIGKSLIKIAQKSH